MPELPEVETVRKGLEDRLENFLIHKIEVLSDRTIASSGGSKLFISSMENALVGSWHRRGKYLIANLFQDSTQKNQRVAWGFWVVHLRMTGYFKWNPKGNKPCPHTRVRLFDKQGNEIRFIDVRNFGQMWWIGHYHDPFKVIPGLNKLGPEPFSKEFNFEYLRQKLKNKKRSIKSTLLDQSVIAGIGNIYADESLFEAGIMPTKESQSLQNQEVKKLCRSIVSVLRKSIGKGGTTFSDFRDLEGINGNYGGEAWVYRRNNMSCKKCDSKILKCKLSGRSTHWCPNCQT